MKPEYNLGKSYNLGKNAKRQGLERIPSVDADFRQMIESQHIDVKKARELEKEWLNGYDSIN